MSVVVNTPHSHIGHALVQRLLAAGTAVTVISRDAERGAALAAQGARVVVGALDDAATLTDAFTGADQIFWLTPPNYRPDFMDWAGATAGLAATTAHDQGVRRVVILSSVGAQNRDTPGHLGPVGALLTVEQTFQAALDNVLVLRPAFFMENLLRDVPTLLNPGALFTVAALDVGFPMVATADIALRAGDVLLDPTWSGHHHRGVHGARNVTYQELAGVLSEALGRPIQAIQVSMDQARGGMAAAGMPPFMVDMFANMYAGFQDGRMAPAEPRDAFSTTPTDINQFARTVLAPAFHAAQG